MELANQSPLIDPNALARSLRDVTVLDVRYRLGGPPGPAEFAAGHIPGAQYVDLDTALAAAPGPRGRHPLPEPDDFASAMRAAGVSRDRRVVVYDDWAGHAAARCWWLLRYHGHPDVRVLDGGWSAWRAAGGEAATGASAAVTVGDFAATPGGLPVVEADTVAEVDVLIDARAAERYRGEVEPIDPVAGHIPGAVNMPTSANLDPDGRFRSAAELAASYAEVGAVPDVSVAAYCGSGVTATHDVLALEIAGIRGASIRGAGASGWPTQAARWLPVHALEHLRHHRLLRLTTTRLGSGRPGAAGAAPLAAALSGKTW